MPETTKDILGQLFGGGTALAGLVLVFLGSITASYEGYDPEARSAVRAQYLRRAWLAFAGFLFALLGAAAGLRGMFSAQALWLPVSIVSLGASGVLLVWIALRSVLDIR